MFKTLLQNFQVIFEPVTISQLFHRVVLKKNVGEGMYLAFRSLEVKRAIIANYFMVQSFKAWYSSAPGIIGMSLLPHHIGPFRMLCCFLAFQPRRGKLSLTDELHWADGFVVVYDISNRASFAFAKALLFRIQECQGGACKRASESSVVLVGNKQDLCHMREIGWDEGQKLALDYKCHFCELSAAEHCQEVVTMFTKVLKNVTSNAKGKEKRRPSGSKSMAKLINNMFGKRRKSV